MTQSRILSRGTLTVIGTLLFIGCDSGVQNKKPALPGKPPAATTASDKHETPKSNSPSAAATPAPSTPKTAEPSAPTKSESAAAPSAVPPADQLSFEWIHDENVPGPEGAKESYDYIVNSVSKGRLVLANHADAVLSKGWAIYFSIGDFIDLDKEDFSKANPTLKLTYSGISGRYKIEPNESFVPLRTNESLTIPYRGNRIVMVTSDRPAGFYLVKVETNGKETVVGDIPIEYGPIAPFKPVPDPIGAQMTAAARYANYAKYPGSAAPQLALPLPKKVNVTDGKSLALGQLQQVKHSQPELKFESELAQKVLAPQGAVQEPPLPTELRIDDKLAREEYHLTVGDAGVQISGGSAAGVFYGVQTLTQMIEASRKSGKLPYVDIEDKPELGHRGLMVDICRHFYGKETFKRVIDQMARYKLNVLQMDLNDDEGWRIEIAALPELTKIGARRGHEMLGPDGKVQMLPVVYDDGSTGHAGFLTRDDYIDIIKYAHERHIEIIPEINVPGHSRSAIQALKDRPGYLLVDPQDKSVHISPQGFTDNIINPAMDGVYPFIETVFAEIKQMHVAAEVPLKRVHIGGDETPVEAWTLSPACAAKGYENVDPKQDKEKAKAVHEKIRLDFSKKVYDIIDKAVSPDIIIGCWHDNVPYILDRMAAGKAFMTDWDIDGEGGYKRVRAGQPTVLCNPRYTYFDMIYELHPSERGHFWSGATDTIKAYAYRPFGLTNNPLKPEERTSILGMQAQIWTETITTEEMFEAYLMPRLLAFCERAWNPDVSEADVAKNWPGFAAYVGEVAMPVLEAANFDFHIPKPGAIDEGGKLKALVPFPELAIHYTIDGNDPVASSRTYDPAAPPAYDAKLKLRTFTKSGKMSATVSLKEN